MGIIGTLMASLVHLLIVGLDVMALFVLAHITAQRWRRPILIALDRVGMPVIQWLEEWLAAYLPRVIQGNRATRTVAIILAVALFMVLRFMLVNAGFWLQGVRAVPVS